MTDRYVVVTRTVSAPKSGGGQYRRPVAVRVYDTAAGGTEWHWVRRLTPGLVREWHNVDSRYDGPRSEYGKAIRQARALAAELNAEVAVSAG